MDVKLRLEPLGLHIDPVTEADVRQAGSGRGDGIGHQDEWTSNGDKNPNDSSFWLPGHY